MCSDSRNDRPSADDRDAPPPRCEFCFARTEDDVRQTCEGCSIRCLCEGARVPLTHVAVDGTGACCDSCATELVRELRLEEDWGRAERVQATMTCAHALRLAVEAALGGSTLLNGGPSYGEDDEPEDETTEVDALPDGRPCSVTGCGRVVGGCPHWAPSYAARRTEAA